MSTRGRGSNRSTTKTRVVYQSTEVLTVRPSHPTGTEPVDFDGPFQGALKILVISGEGTLAEWTVSKPIGVTQLDSGRFVCNNVVDVANLIRRANNPIGPEIKAHQWKLVQILEGELAVTNSYDYAGQLVHNGNPRTDAVRNAKAASKAAWKELHPDLRPDWTKESGDKKPPAPSREPDLLYIDHMHASMGAVERGFVARVKDYEKVAKAVFPGPGYETAGGTRGNSSQPTLHPVHGRTEAAVADSIIRGIEDILVNTAENRVVQNPADIGDTGGSEEAVVTAFNAARSAILDEAPDKELWKYKTDP